MNSVLTFGKYKGQTPSSIKDSDVDYLVWGSCNLKSDKWRKEFQEALDSSTTYADRMDEQAKQDTSDDEWFSSLDSKFDTIVQKYAELVGMEFGKLKPLATKYTTVNWMGESPTFTANQFASKKKFDLFSDMVEEIFSIQ